MKKISVRILCAALAVCFVLAALTACGGDAKDEAKKVSITVIDGDTKIPVEIETGKTVKDALDAAKITLGENDTVDPRIETKITADAKEITIKRGAKADAAIKVSLTIDGKQSEISTSAKTVDELLKEQKITLGEEDKINAKLTDKVTAGMQLKIVRTTYKEEKKTEKIAFDTEETVVDSLEAGQSEVVREGAEGQKEVTYKVKYVDGKEAGREVVSEKVIKEPVNKQVNIGAGSSDNGDNGDDGNEGDEGDVDEGNEGDEGGEDEVYEVSRVDMPNCNGDGHGYYIVTYSDGHQEYPEY